VQRQHQHTSRHVTSRHVTSRHVTNKPLGGVHGHMTFTFKDFLCRHVPLRAVTCRHVPLRAVTCRYVPSRTVTCRHVPLRAVTYRYVPSRTVTCRHVPLRAFAQTARSAYSIRHARAATCPPVARRISVQFYTDELYENLCRKPKLGQNRIKILRELLEDIRTSVLLAAIQQSVRFHGKIERRCIVDSHM